LGKPKLGGKETLRLLIFGNTDLADSLLSAGEGGSKLDHALGALVEEKYQGATKILPALEPGLRSDLLLQRLEGRPIPEEVVAQALHESGFVAAQFQPPAPDDADIVVLSLAPEATQETWRHQAEGYLLAPPPGWEQSWSSEQQAWFKDGFEPCGTLSAEASKQQLLQVVRLIKDQLDAHAIVYNCSTVDPADQTYNYHGIGETIPLRIQRLNRAIIEISVKEGISIIDADRVLAEIGARENVSGVLDYSKRACQALCEETLRVMEDIGFFEKRPLIMQIGHQGK